MRVGDTDSQRRVAQLKSLIGERAAQNRRLAARNEQMRANVRELRANGDYVVEELARKWLFMIKPDEIYVVPAPQPK